MCAQHCSRWRTPTCVQAGRRSGSKRSESLASLRAPLPPTPTPSPRRTNRCQREEAAERPDARSVGAVRRSRPSEPWRVAYMSRVCGSVRPSTAASTLLTCTTGPAEGSVHMRELGAPVMTAWPISCDHCRINTFNTTHLLPPACELSRGRVNSLKRIGQSSDSRI